MLFSKRHGHSTTRFEPQVEAMDDDLRSGLWNVFHGVMFGTKRERGAEEVLRIIWTEIYKRPVDDVPYNSNYYKAIFMKAPWFEVYDIVEFLSAYDPTAREFDRVLSRDNAGYRIIDGKVTPIVEEVEVSEVNSVLENASGPFDLARQHVARAVELLSDRESPDYRNAIKEAISGAESAARVTTGKRNFCEALKELQAQGLHPALAGVFGQLYGYSSDESGVRHALVAEDRTGAAEAHYMIVSCSAFISYLMHLPAAGHQGHRADGVR